MYAIEPPGLERYASIDRLLRDCPLWITAMRLVIIHLLCRNPRDPVGQPPLIGIDSGLGGEIAAG